MRLVSTTNGWEDYTYWLQADSQMVKRINRLIDAVSDNADNRHYVTLLDQMSQSPNTSTSPSRGSNPGVDPHKRGHQLVDALCACDRPASVLTWKLSPRVRAVLAAIATGATALCHDGLEEPCLVWLR